MMKKVLLMCLSLLPLLTFGQGYGQSDSSTAAAIITLIFGLGICIIILLVLRQLFLWYWKVEVVIKKQEEQIQLLRSIYNSIEENNRLTQAQIELVTHKSEHIQQ